MAKKKKKATKGVFKPSGAGAGVPELEPLVGSDPAEPTWSGLPVEQPVARPSAARSWLRIGSLSALLVLMAAGIAISVYMSWHHELELYGSGFGELYGCATSEHVDCGLVNTSEWSEIFGVPLFTWAIPTYALVAVLAAWALRGKSEALGLVAAIGVLCAAFSGFLYYISVVELGKVCQWCLRLYAINAAVLLLPLLAGPKLPDLKVVGWAGGLFAGLVVAVVGPQQVYRSQVLLAETPELPELPDEAEIAKAEPERDPEGPAPVMSFEVNTEDSKPDAPRIATLTTRPEDVWKGNPQAKVAVVEFADLQCGYCKRASGQLKRVYEAYKDDIVFVFKHFPMNPQCNPGVTNNRHRYACSAAIASTCAQKQGKFWAFHDLAFKNQHQLETEHLRTYAEAVGMDLSAFDKCVRDPAVHAHVRADGEVGKSLDIHGTPRIYINGRLYRAGTSAQQYARAIETALREAGETPAQEKWRSVGDILSPGIKPIPPDVPEMQKVELGGLSFYIDTFEASLKEGNAFSGKHEIPATRMSWYAARDACAKAGKRMCTEEEWITACQGLRPIDDDADGHYADDQIEGNAYPYADYHEDNYCWEAKDRDTMRPVYTGEMPGCVTQNEAGYTAYDLTGNVEEWVGASDDAAILLGGAFDTEEDHARCYRLNDTFGPGFANMRTGFRCCKDAK